MTEIQTIHGMHCSKAFEERDEARRELAVLTSQLAGVEALARINEDGYEADIERLTRELAERNAVCQAHMELRYNAEREQRLAADLAWRMEIALRDLWRVADACGHCCNADETDRAFALMAERVDIPKTASASTADLGKAGYFSSALPPSYGGTDE